MATAWPTLRRPLLPPRLIDSAMRATRPPRPIPWLALLPRSRSLRSRRRLARTARTGCSLVFRRHCTRRTTHAITRDRHRLHWTTRPCSPWLRLRMRTLGFGLGLSRLGTALRHLLPSRGRTRTRSTAGACTRKAVASTRLVTMRLMNGMSMRVCVRFGPAVRGVGVGRAKSVDGVRGFRLGRLRW